MLAVEIAGDFAIHPPWLDPPAGLRSIEIDPGHAFGSGSHASTRLALELLEGEVEPGHRVFDVGCGSGILAIGAAILGAGVVAVDIDPAAVSATLANAERNEVAHLIHVVVGSAGHPTDPADLVIVNVTIDIHEALAPRLDPHHRRLLLAGMLGPEQLSRSARAYDATIERTVGHDGWMAAVLTRS